MRLATSTASLMMRQGATHFFGFYHRPGIEQMRGAIAAALDEWGWNVPH